MPVMPPRSTCKFLVLVVLSLAACGPDYDPAHPGVRAALYGTDEQAATVCATGTLIQGIDVSSYQGTIDWAQVASSGRRFGYAKATEGTGYQDGTFAANFTGMKAQGMLRGAYHFLRASLSGTAQADYFLSFVGGPSGLGELPPMLDWEVTDGVSASQNATEASAFIAEIQAKTGRPTLLYTDPGFWSSIGSPAQFASSPFWVADWGAPCPAIPSPWSSWVIWQYSDTGSVPGISGNVDLDEFDGSLARLQQFAGVPISLPIAQQSGNDAITAVNWPDGHLDVFARSPAGAELHVSTSGAGDTFGSAATLDTGAACGSAAAFWGAPWSYPELWSPLSAGGTGHLWYTSGGGWNQYQPLGGSDLSHLATLVWLDGRSEVFALGAGGAIWHDSWDLAKSAWSGWSSLGGSFSTGPATVTWSNGTGELFATDAAGDLWHSWSGTGASYPNGWYAWTKMTRAGGAIASRPSAVRWADGHAQVFARGADGKLYASDFSMQSGWPALSAVGAGSILGNPSAIMNVAGKGASPGPEVFARDATGHLVHLGWNGSSYGAFQPLGDEVASSDPLGWIHGDGTAEVFAVDTNGDLVHTLHDPTAGWSAWAAIATGVDPCVPPLPEVDGGAPWDAGETSDAGESVPDAGWNGSDSGEVAPDGGAGARSGEAPDAGALYLGGYDAGGPQTDAGSLTPLHVSNGCGCRTAGGPDATLVLLLLPLFALRRRLRRRFG